MAKASKETHVVSDDLCLSAFERRLQTSRHRVQTHLGCFHTCCVYFIQIELWFNLHPVAFLLCTCEHSNKDPLEEVVFLPYGSFML